MKDAQVGRGKIETSECVYRYSLTKPMHVTQHLHTDQARSCNACTVLCCAPSMARFLGLTHSSKTKQMVLLHEGFHNV